MTTEAEKERLYQEFKKREEVHCKCSAVMFVLSLKQYSCPECHRILMKFTDNTQAWYTLEIFEEAKDGSN